VSSTAGAKHLTVNKCRISTVTRQQLEEHSNCTTTPAGTAVLNTHKWRSITTILRHLGE
jgi:hypothetical protein